MSDAVPPRPWLRHYPPGVRPSLQYPRVPLYHYLDRAADRHPEAVATVFFGARLTYRQVRRRADALAAALQALGIAKGERVAVMLPNCPQAVVAFYGVLKAGAVAVMTNPLYTEREVEYQLRDSGSRAMITLDVLYPKVAAVRARTALERVIVTSLSEALPVPVRWLYPLRARREGQRVGVPRDGTAVPFAGLLRRYTDARPAAVDLDPERDLAVLQYTGGTTGTSKGAMLSHFNLVANVEQVREWMGGGEEARERVLCLMPFFHVYGLTVGMGLGVALAAALILLPRMDVGQLLDAIQRHRPTMFPGAPSVYVAINQFPDVRRYDLRSIRQCISGSAPLPVEVQERFEALTGGRLVEGYGLTEASPVTHCNPLTGTRKVGSIGVPLPDTDMKIVDLETGAQELEPGAVGELCVRGPQVMLGYWNRPDETAAVLRDGWLYTGDVARVDEDGFTYIVDRKKDVIIVSGYNVYPREVEEVLYEHPAVLEAAVVGVPDPRRGERVKAFVVLKPGAQAGEEELIAFCRQRLAPFKCPREIEFRASLPKSAVGKVLRRRLRDEARAGSA